MKTAAATNQREAAAINNQARTVIVCSPRYKMSTTAAMVEIKPDNVAEVPLTRPRIPLGILRPNTSFVLIDENARAMENIIRENKINQPAAVGERNIADAPIVTTARACARQLAIKIYLRILTRFTQLEIIN